MAEYEFEVLKHKSNTFYFATDFGLAYEVLFEPSGYIFPDYLELEPNTFELIIRLVANTKGKRTPLDSRIAATVAAIFKTFLARNERVIIYICESSDRRQVARARKFDGWFEYYSGVDF